MAVRCAVILLAAFVPSTLGAPEMPVAGQAADTAELPLLERVRRQTLEVRATVMAVTYPMRTGSSKNRLFALLTWDTSAFWCCAALFLLMSLLSIRAEEELREKLLGETPGLVSRVLQVLRLFVIDFVTGQFWSTWQSQITFAVVKLVFMLSSIPFFIFTLGPMSTLFTHTDATAYTRNGTVVGVDPNGLSAYLSWIKEDVLGPYSKFKAELEDESQFHPKSLAKLRAAVREAEGVLASAWRRPATVMKVTRAKRAELDALLATVVTKEAASAALYRHCFPDQVIVDDYKRRVKAEADEMAAEMRVGQVVSGNL